MPPTPDPTGLTGELTRRNLETVRDDLTRAVNAGDVPGALQLVTLWAAWSEAADREGVR